MQGRKAFTPQLFYQTSLDALVKRCSSMVELVLGTLINHHNMRRINSRGVSEANKHALCYNHKKYLKFSRKTPHIIAQSMALMEGIHFHIKTSTTRAQFS